MRAKKRAVRRVFSYKDFGIFHFACVKVVDELFCAARRTPALAERPTLGKRAKLFVGGADIPVFGELAHDGQVLRFAGGREVGTD